MHGRVKQSGVALFYVTVFLSILSVVVSTFVVNAKTNLLTAYNVRDRLRAEKLAQSALGVGQGIIALQSFLVKQGLVNSGQFFLPDQAQLIIQQLIGSAPELPSGITLELRIQSEDGKYPLACVGGPTPREINQKLFYFLVKGITSHREYDQFFNMTKENSVESRDELAQSIIDWLDTNRTTFQLDGRQGGPENSYNFSNANYEARNFYLDTQRELRLVRGMSTDLYKLAFENNFTPYGRINCNISVLRASKGIWAGVLAASLSEPALSSSEQIVGLAELLSSRAKTILPLLPSLVKDANYKYCVPKNPSVCKNFLSDPSSEIPTKINNNIDRLSEVLCSPMAANLFAGAKPSLGNQTEMTYQPLPICPGVLSMYFQEPSKDVPSYYELTAKSSIQGGSGREVNFSVRAIWAAKNYVNNPSCNRSQSCNIGSWFYYRTQLE